MQRDHPLSNSNITKENSDHRKAVIKALFFPSPKKKARTWSTTVDLILDKINVIENHQNRFTKYKLPLESLHEETGGFGGEGH